MDRVSRPLLGLLLGTVAFFALWVVALKPSSSPSGSGSPSGLGRYNSAIAAAHNAVATAAAASLAHGGTVPAPGIHLPSAAVKPSSPSTATRPAAGFSPAQAHRGTVLQGTPGSREQQVVRALRAHRVVALLFFNPPGADDRVVRRELATIPSHGGQVLILAVPLSDLALYPVITRQVPVTGSPTLVLINRKGAATTLVGFSGRFEIAQLVHDALASATPVH